jgi:hypothetical protein
MCEICSVHRAQDSPQHCLSAAEAYEMVKSQFVNRRLFDTFANMDGTFALWGLGMIDHALEFQSDKLRIDPYITRRFRNVRGPDRLWVERVFPQYEGSSIVTFHRAESGLLVVDYAISDPRSKRPTLDLFEQRFLPFLAAVE